MQSAPKRIGKYELISRLGRGGMGEVYKAFHPQLQRYVAIKVLLTNSETDPEFIARFQQEAMAVARLRHPHIVQVFDFDIEDDKPYMVMEYIEGETLAQRMARYHRNSQFMPLDEVGRLFGHLCQAVDYAHQQHMLHRDLKPANVIINKHNDAILTDFGLAKIAGVTGLTASGTLLGTPHYMSPEQGQGQPMDERSDVYSLSVMLYEALEGKVPFEADTPVAVIMQHIGAPPPLANKNPAVPPALAQIAQIGMAKKPDERFRRAGAMGAAIGTALNRPLAPVRSGPSGGAETNAARPEPEAARPLDTVASPSESLIATTRMPPEGNGPETPPKHQPVAQPERAGERAAPPISPAPGTAPRRRSKNLTRLLIIGILLLFLASTAGVLAYILSTNSKGTTGPGVTSSGIVGTVTFSDSDLNDFSHPANVLTGTFTNLKQPASGSTYFAWLCDSAGPNCTLLGPLSRQSDGKASFVDNGQANFLGGPTLKQLQSTLTFEITAEQTEASSPPASPSKQVAYSGQLQANLLLHIRHQLTAFPKQGVFANNTTALDTGLGNDAVLLQQLGQQLQQAQSAGRLAYMQKTAEEIFNLIAGKEGASDLNNDGTISIAQGDDGFGIGIDATIHTDCAGGQNGTYLSLTMQHACLAAKVSNSAALEHIFTMITEAGNHMAISLTSIENSAKMIATAQNTSVVLGAVTTLAQQADNVLTGSTSETQTQPGAQQLLTYSEQMASITVSSVG